MDIDAEFTPNILNSMVFIYTFFMQTVNIIVNYQGEPWMESFYRNRTLMKISGAIVLVNFAAIIQLEGVEVEYWLELVEF